MAVYGSTIDIRTKATVEVCNITNQVEKAVTQSKIKEGLVLVYCPHTTAAIIINESETRLICDLEKMVEDIIPWNKRYAHNEIDGNAASHLVGSIIDNNATLPISAGAIDLGTWQNIFLLEMDGARTRQVSIKVIGE